MVLHEVHQSREDVLHFLFRSLDQRRQPEDVAKQIVTILDCTPDERRLLNKAANSRQPGYWSSMSADFSRPVGMKRQLKVAEQLFGHPVTFSLDDLEQIEQWVENAEQSIGKAFGRNDFKFDRLPKEERAKQGIELSRRQYNKRFRLAARLERKMYRFRREQIKRSLQLASKNRLASDIKLEDFKSDVNTACFVAYYVARCNLRSVFTNTSQIRPFDEICDALLKRCLKQRDTTNWWTIAHVYPVTEVLEMIDDDRKGILLGRYFDRLCAAAWLLKELMENNQFRDDMIVQPGNDSSTWNLTAGAWNKLREGWFSLLYSLGMTDSIEKVCPGKVLRLMAADVAYWHKTTGGNIHPDTQVWKELPSPWEVLSGAKLCPRILVEEVCHRYGVDPVKSSWTAPNPGRTIQKFTPTPELVHGVAVSSPELASLFRKCGVFSGKNVETLNSAEREAVNDARFLHLLQQEEKAAKKGKYNTF